MEKAYAFYAEIAKTAVALRNCEARSDETAKEFSERHRDRLSALQGRLPSGSGFDRGCTIDLDRTDLGAVVVYTCFHHMDDVGYYDGWTWHRVTIRPSFLGLDIKISGRNRNDIKDYIDQAFRYCGE